MHSGRLYGHEDDKREMQQNRRAKGREKEKVKEGEGKNEDVKNKILWARFFQCLSFSASVREIRSLNGNKKYEGIKMRMRGKNFFSLKENISPFISDSEDRSVPSASIRRVCSCEWVVRAGTC